jgi:DNA-binding response OmpR family regulator
MLSAKVGSIAPQAPERDLRGRQTVVLLSARATDFAWLTEWCRQRALRCEIREMGRDDCGPSDVAGAALLVADTKEVLRTLGRDSSCPRAQRPKTLAMAATSHEAGAALASGAADAIRKPFTREELGARIERLVATEAPMLQCSSLQLDRTRCQVLVDGKLLTLRKAEYTLLKYLLAEQPRVVPTHELLQVALGTCGDGGTIRYHICELRRKLRAAGADHLYSRRGHGYWIATDAAARHAYE